MTSEMALPGAASWAGISPTSSNREVGAGELILEGLFEVFDIDIEACREDMPGLVGAMAGVAVPGVLISSTPSPEVTSGLGSGFLPQNDHLLFAPSALRSLASAAVGASGSPSRDRDSQGADGPAG